MNNGKKPSLRIRFVTGLISGLVLLMLNWSGQTTSAQANLPNGSELLQKYQLALSQLPPRPPLTYQQQVEVSGKQSYRATVDTLLRQDGSWQAWAANGESIQFFDSQLLKFVDLSFFGISKGISKVTPTYHSQQANQVNIELNNNFNGDEVKSIQLVSWDNNRSAYHLMLEGKGQLKELWLDPESALPYRAALNVTGEWGKAKVFIDFQPVAIHWLPKQIEIDANYQFQVLFVGYSGQLQIRQDFQDYRLFNKDDKPQFLPDQPPINGSPVISGIRSESASSEVISGGSQPQFNLGIEQKRQSNVLSQRISDFNVNRPTAKEPLAQILILISLPLGKQAMPLYTLEFNAEKLRL